MIGCEQNGIVVKPEYVYSGLNCLSPVVFTGLPPPRLGNKKLVNGNKSPLNGNFSRFCGKF